MKTNFIRVLLIAILVSIVLPIQAQVTIGSGSPPVAGALLEIKDKNPANPLLVTDNANVTSSTGGLGLPRVKLESKTSLMPFVDAATTQMKITHAGLTVYNLTSNDAFSPGMYVWDGARWKNMEQKYFYMPSFNLPLPANATGQIFNIYDEYCRQFKRQVGSTTNPNFVSSNSNSLSAIEPLYSASELYFVVTDYDSSVIKVNSISDAGVLNYDVLIDTQPSAASYVNIIFVVK